MDAIRKLISLNIEIEGLLRVMEARDSNDARGALAEKFSEYERLFRSTFQAEEATVLPCEKNAIGSLPTDDTEDEHEENLSDAVAVGDSRMVSDDMVTGDAISDDMSGTVLNEEPSEESCSKDDQENDGEEIVVRLERDNMQTEDDYTVPQDGDMRVDEMISRREARDLNKAFTLNDKFRFCRELFGNDKAEFADTLDLVSAMNSMEEASDYLFNDLKWDAENDDVKDFVAILTNHFNSK